MVEGSSEASSGERSSLLVVATTAEAGALCRGLDVKLEDDPRLWSLRELTPRFDLLITGVGKANAAGAVARGLDLQRHDAVINVGLAGALPGSELEIGEVVLATSSVFADEGVQTPEGFEDLESMGLADEPGSATASYDDLRSHLAHCADREGVVATVSTCSGTDEAAVRIARRCGAIAEAMEGAALAHVVRRINEASHASARVVFAELRAVSNTTGDRSRQRWDLEAAFEAMARIARQL